MASPEDLTTTSNGRDSSVQNENKVIARQRKGALKKKNVVIVKPHKEKQHRFPSVCSDCEPTQKSESTVMHRPTNALQTNAKCSVEDKPVYCAQKLRKLVYKLMQSAVSRTSLSTACKNFCTRQACCHQQCRGQTCRLHANTSCLLHAITLVQLRPN